MLFNHVPIVIRGGGDLASGVIYRLHRAGFPVIVIELEAPLFVRRTVCYGDAVYSSAVTVQGITARFVADAGRVPAVIKSEEIPVLIDAQGQLLARIRPVVVVDARMAKINPGTSLGDAPLVIALGPGFVAGQDCHALIETNRGHDLGRVIDAGAAEANTGVPGRVLDEAHRRVLRAPVAGSVSPRARIGDIIEEGALIATIDTREIRAPFAGVLRGLIHERVEVKPGMKIGDLDPRGLREHCFTLSDKSLAVGGGVLEAVLAAPQVRRYMIEPMENEPATGV